MSKTTWTLIMSAVLLVSLGIAELRYIESSADILLVRLGQVRDSLKRGDWVATRQELSEFKFNWAKTSRSWTLFLNHREIDEINMSVARAQGYAGVKDRGLLTAELIQIKELVSHIPVVEQVTFNNIL